MHKKQKEYHKGSSLSLKEQIDSDLKEAMRQKQKQKRDALRLLTSAIKQVEVDEQKRLDDAAVIAIIQKQIKQREDAIAQYTQADREDLAAKERFEMECYRVYLPAQLSDDALKEALSAIIQELNASSMRDMGKVMQVATKQLAGRADGKRISECVKRLLAK